MDFRFLGPLEVRSAGTLLPLGGHKQRGVLAVLLLNAGSVVSVDRLVDDVWGETAPRTVHAYVQNCVSRLRTVLGRDAIETHPSGYLLRVDEEDVDAFRFARAVEAARTLEPPERVAALGEALALWRGEPLAEFAFEPFAQPEITRLEELRLAAVESRLEAQLELGLHADALPELESLAARHPARERLRYLQMLALYRAGRQHEALAAYQEARRELIERFGLDPGDELRALERMILAQDPSLRQPPPREQQQQPPTRTCIALAVEPGDGAAEEVVGRLEGTILARSDTLVAAWGMPLSHDADALRALAAAGALHDAVPGARVAIERVPTDDSFDRRLLDGASPGDTLLGPRMLMLVAHAVDVVAHPAGGFRVLRVDEDAEPLPRRFDTPLVGRLEELRRLRHELETVRAGGAARRRIVVGDAGIGKTRLAREFAGRAPARTLWARCTSHAGGDPIGHLLEQAGPLDAALAGEADGPKIAAVLAARGRVAWTEERWALRRLLETLARGEPVLVVLDDVQWASANVLDLVDYLVGWARAPILVLGLARPELTDRRPDVVADAWHVEPLPAQDALRLVHVLAEGRALEPHALASVAQTAEGNPLYIEQFVAWSSEERSEDVPPTIERLIEMRVERLADDERRMLERAAVVGAEFWRGGVEAASPDDERGDVAPALMALVRHRLVRPAPTLLDGDDGFRFHHALIRDVVYAGISEDARARMHAAVARSLGPDERHDAIAGLHLERAALVDPTLGDDAAHRLRAAGLRALRRIDAVAAGDFLSRAARLTPEGPRRRELDWGVATATKFAGDPVRAESLLEDVAVRAAAAGDRTNELRARVEQVWPRLGRGGLRVEEALDLLAGAVEAFEEAGDEFAAARAWDITAAVNGVYLLREAACEQSERRARELYERSGSTSGAADVRLAGAAYLGPRPAIEAIALCQGLLDESDTPVWASFVQPFLALLLAMRGRFDDARTALEDARAGRAEFSDPRTLDTSWAVFAAEVATRAGRLDDAEGVLTDAAERLRATGDTEWIATNAAVLGTVLLRQGRDEEALVSADHALAGAPAAHLTICTIARRVRAVALARLGRVDEGIVEATKNVDALAQADALVEQARARAALAEVLDHGGDGTAADEHRAAAIALLERKGDVVGVRELAGD